ncbi:hypothetical protein ACEPAG_8934 [Sanghuangporus baumii]
MSLYQINSVLSAFHPNSSGNPNRFTRLFEALASRIRIIPSESARISSNPSPRCSPPDAKSNIYTSSSPIKIEVTISREKKSDPSAQQADLGPVDQYLLKIETRSNISWLDPQQTMSNVCAAQYYKHAA